jgi:hypothetical protein
MFLIAWFPKSATSKEPSLLVNIPNGWLNLAAEPVPLTLPLRLYDPAITVGVND